MESEYKAIQHEHISFEDIELVNTLDEEDVSDAEWALFLKVHEMVDDCSVCRQRYKLYINLQSAFAAFSPEKHFLNERVVHCFQQSLLQADQALHKRLASWLEGSRNLMNDLGQMTLQPALAGAARGLEDNEKIVDLEVPVVGDDGFFMFELQQETKLNFSIKKETVDGQPVCLAVFGRESTDFSAVYPLTPFGKDYLRAKTSTVLPPGQYALCVPTMRADE